MVLNLILILFIFYLSFAIWLSVIEPAIEKRKNENIKKFLEKLNSTD